MQNAKEGGDALVMSVSEAGRKLGLSRNTAYEAAKRGDIPVLKIGRRLLVPVAALERLLDGGSNPKSEREPEAA